MSARRPFAIVLTLLLSGAGHARTEVPASRNAPDMRPLPLGTQILVPLKPGVRLKWIVTGQEKMFKTPQDLQFDVDDKGRPWFGHKKLILASPAQKWVMKLQEPYEQFVLLDDGSLVLRTKTALGTAEIQPAAQDTALMNAVFKPGIVLPVYDRLHMFPGNNGALYLAGRNPRTRKHEIFLLKGAKGKTGTASMEKLLETSDEVTAMAGNGEITFIALGKLIVRVETAAKKVERQFLHPRQTIHGLAYSEKAGLFYATASRIGCLGPQKQIEFLKASKPEMRIRGDFLYIFLRESQEVLKLEGLSQFQKL